MKQNLFLNFLHVIILLSIVCVSGYVDNCQSFKEFMRKHILPTSFKTNKGDLGVWGKYLLKNKLCGKIEKQSFIKSSEKNIKQICNGSGSVSGNYTKSKDLFEVYRVKSSEGIKPKCIVTSCTSGKYNVFVKCENKEPVHYGHQEIEQNTYPQPC
uniref:Uncharacterized protein n=1 Tax=Cyprinus carpio TaxID=7962 RepID=A0A8C1WDD9_CYPCA